MTDGQIRAPRESRTNGRHEQSEKLSVERDLPAGSSVTEQKQFALTLDLENDWYFDEPGYDHLTFEYIDEFIRLVDGLDIPLSIFVVGRTLERYPEVIDRLRSELDSEFHLHSYSHELERTTFEKDLEAGITAFRDHFGTDPIGYRAPYGKIDASDFETLAAKGFLFDSSIFPSYRPGVYRNLDTPLEPYSPGPAPELLEIPIGVVRGLRIPLSQNYLKLFGRPLLELLSEQLLPDTLVYNIHLQDLYRTESYDNLGTVKSWIMERNLNRSPEILKETVQRLQSAGYRARSMSEIYEQNRVRTKIQYSQ